MVRSLKEDSSNSGRGQSTKQDTPKAQKAPHWRIEKKNYTHKPANPGEFKYYIRAQFCDCPLEIRYCKAKYTAKPDCRDEQITKFMEELKGTGMLDDKQYSTVDLAVDAVFSMKGDYQSLKSMFGMDCNIYRHHVAITVRTAIPEFVNVDKLQGCLQILIYPADWSKY